MVTGVWLYDDLNIVPHTGHCASWFFFFNFFFIYLFIFLNKNEGHHCGIY